MTNIIKKITTVSIHNGRDWKEHHYLEGQELPEMGRWCKIIDESYMYYSTDYKGDYGKYVKFDKEIITLSNGRRVANFSSPHEFKFEDGSILSAHSAKFAESYKVIFNQIEGENGDISLTFTLSELVMEEVNLWQSAFEIGIVDIVYIPLPMMTALKDMGYNIINSPFRVIFIQDRVNKLVSITKQCI